MTKKKKELLQRKKAVLQARITREKLLQAIVEKQKEGRPVNIMRNVTDRIPNVMVKKRSEEIKPTFFSKRGLL